MTNPALAPLVELVADFVAYMGGDLRHGTTRAYHDDLRQFVQLSAARDVKALPDVSREAVSRYLGELRAQGYHPNTIHRRLAALQSFYRYLAVERGWSTNPTLRLRQDRRPDPVPWAYGWATALAILAEVPDVTALDAQPLSPCGLDVRRLPIAETRAELGERIATRASHPHTSQDDMYRRSGSAEPTRDAVGRARHRGWPPLPRSYRYLSMILGDTR